MLSGMLAVYQACKIWTYANHMRGVFDGDFNLAV